MVDRSADALFEQGDRDTDAGEGEVTMTTSCDAGALILPVATASAWCPARTSFDLAPSFAGHLGTRLPEGEPCQASASGARLTVSSTRLTPPRRRKTGREPPIAR